MNKQLQARVRTNGARKNWLRRGEWNLLLLASLCALLAISPAAGASLAASSLAVSSLNAAAPDQYEAVLWWLQHSAAGASQRAMGLTAGASSAMLDGMAPGQNEAQVAAQQVAAWLHTLSDALPTVRDTGITILADESASVPPLLQPATGHLRTRLYAFSHAGSRLSASPLSLAALAASALRYDGSRRLAAGALSFHEAALRCGVRTNRFLE